MPSLTLEYTLTSSPSVTQTYSSDNITDIKNEIARVKSYIKTAKISGKHTQAAVYVNCNSLFEACTYLETIDLSEFDTSNVADMNYMFKSCSSLTSIIGSNNLDTSNLTSLDSMFRGCSSLTNIDVSNFNTSNVTRTSNMFKNCSALTTIYCNSDWNTPIVTLSGNMFIGCTNLVGAVPYDSTQIDITMANPTTGYFTAVPIPTSLPITFNELEVNKIYFNDVEINHLNFNGTSIY